MGRRNDHTREEIREMALDAGLELLEAEGISALSARKIAARINYTVGTLYLVFENLDDLILQVNLRTLNLMRERMRACIDADLEPVAQLKKIAEVYLKFAQKHHSRWRLVYEHTSDIRNEVYTEYMQVSQGMLMLVENQLAKLSQGDNRIDDGAIAMQARALWGGVHGICILSLSGKLDHGDFPIGDMTDLLIEQFVYGLGGRQ